MEKKLSVKAMFNKNIDISKIKVQFGGKYAPKDEELLNLLKDAYRGKLLVRTALVKIEGIKTFSDFNPQISKEYRDYFENHEKRGVPPSVMCTLKGIFSS